MLSRLKTALKREPKPPGPLSVEFDQSQTYTAGSSILGVVHLQLTEDDAHEPDMDRKGKGRMRGGTGRKAIDEVIVRLRVLQVSTYQQIGGQGVSVYSGSSDFRTQHTLLLAEDQVLWRSDFPVEPSSTPSTSADPCTLSRTLSPRSITSDASVDDAGLLSLTFAFRLPSWLDQQETHTVLPPSFEGGTRSQAGEVGIGRAIGAAVGRNAYFISVVGVRSSRLVKDEKIIRPFLYFPPDIVDPANVPLPIVAPPAANGSLPSLPPPRPASEEWRTVTTEKHVRMGGFMSAKGQIRIEMTAPSLPVLPPHHPIPFRVEMTVRSPPIGPEDAAQPQLRIPSPSTLSFDLIRTVDTQAQGARQFVRQFVSRVGHLDDERRVWYGDTTQVQMQNAQGETEKRWACTVVIVGEFVLGGEKAGKKEGFISPSFPRPHGGGLGCKYSLTLRLPLKGTTADFWVEDFLSFGISSPAHVDTDSDLLPAYYAAGDELDFDDDKKL